MRFAITILIHILLLPDDVAAKAMAKIKEAMQRVSTETSKIRASIRRSTGSDVSQEGQPRRRLSSDPIRQIACPIDGSTKGAQLVLNDNGVNDSSIFYRSTLCKKESTRTWLNTVMLIKDVERILKLKKKWEICAELQMHFRIYHKELGAAMADAKACDKALRCALQGGPKDMVCVVYYAEDSANRTITYAEKVFLKEPEPKIHANRTSTYVTHLEDDFNASYVKDCSFLGKPTIYRCEALGVKYAYELKDWTSHTWTTGRHSPHASAAILRQRKRFRFRQFELLRQQHMIRLLLPLLRQEYLRQLASTQTREVIDTLIDDLIDEGTKDDELTTVWRSRYFFRILPRRVARVTEFGSRSSCPLLSGIVGLGVNALDLDEVVEAAEVSVTLDLSGWLNTSTVLQGRIALFLASVVRDVDRLQNIVTVTASTRVRIKAAETLIRGLYAKGDKERLSKVTKDLIFTQAPHLKKCIINTILGDDMQGLADAIIDAVLASYGPHLATQLLPACSEAIVCRLLPVVVPRPGPTSRKLILRYPQAMFDFITTSNTGEALAVEYHAEIEYFIRHRINAEPKALSLVMAYMDAMLEAGKGTTAYWLVDRGIMPILSLLMESGHSNEVIKWLKEKNHGRQLSYKDDPWNLSFNAARDWPVEALVRDLGREETFELLSEVVSMEYMHTLTRRVSNNKQLRYELTAYMWHKAVVADIPLGRIPTLDVCIALKGQLDLLGEVAIDCYNKQFPDEDQRLAYVEYMPGSEADTVLADRLKSSDTSKRVWAYKNRLQQALHYDKKEHRLPQVLQRTVKEIANEQNPVRGDVMTTLRSLPVPPLCEPKSKDPHAV
ncbi:hypothetical protein FOZ63_021191, partial [Perkinsus olseni]